MKMNKIIVDKENVIEIKDNVVTLDIQVDELVIHVKGKVLIHEVNIKSNEELKLTIYVHPNSSLIYNRFMIHKLANNLITLKQDNNSEAVFNYSMIAHDTCKLVFNSELLGDNNETEINLYAVTENEGNCNITSTADTKPKIVNNNLIESIKILVLNNEESVCVPNLLVASNEIEVNHACTISSIDPSYLFYLNSKGLDNEKAIKLIKNGCLLGNLDIDDEMRSKIQDIIGGE